MTCGTKFLQTSGTGRHWRRRLPSEYKAILMTEAFPEDFLSRLLKSVGLLAGWAKDGWGVVSACTWPQKSPIQTDFLNVSCRHGVRNSLLMAPMPTASTAQILGNNESIEPYTSNIYTRRVLSGEFQVMAGTFIMWCVLASLCRRLEANASVGTGVVFCVATIAWQLNPHLGRCSLASGDRPLVYKRHHQKMHLYAVG